MTHPDRTSGCDITTIIKRDGQQWETQTNVKTLEAHGVTVVFQWRDERPAKAPEAAA